LAREKVEKVENAKYETRQRGVRTFYRICCQFPFTDFLIAAAMGHRYENSAPVFENIKSSTNKQLGNVTGL
jgi:hypothetical protein